MRRICPLTLFSSILLLWCSLTDINIYFNFHFSLQSYTALTFYIWTRRIWKTKETLYFEITNRLPLEYLQLEKKQNRINVKTKGVPSILHWCSPLLWHSGTLCIQTASSLFLHHLVMSCCHSDVSSSFCFFFFFFFLALSTTCRRQNSFLNHILNIFRHFAQVNFSFL